MVDLWYQPVVSTAEEVSVLGETWSRSCYSRNVARYEFPHVISFLITFGGLKFIYGRSGMVRNVRSGMVMVLGGRT